MSLLRTPLARLVAKATGFRLSPCQRALLAIGSGQRVQDLAGEEKEAASCALGYDHGPDRRLVELFLNCGARAGKTMLASYIATHRALVTDISQMAPGETARVPFLSASMRQARAGLNYSRGFIQALGLGGLIVSDRRDSFTLKRDGHLIEFATVRGNVGGDTLAGFWYPACVVHEAAIATDPSSGAVALDLDAVEGAVRPRLLPPRSGRPGGLIVLESTSRDAAGAAYERAELQGQPDARCVVFRASTLELRPDDEPLQEHVEAERERDPVNAQREFDAVWVSAQGSGRVFDDDLITPCLADTPTNLPPVAEVQAWAGVDLAFSGDGSALAIVRRAGDGLELCSLRRWKPRKGEPLQPSVVIGAALDEVQRHGVRHIWADVHHIEQLRELAAKRKGIVVKQCPGGTQGKVATHGSAQEMMGSGRFHMGKDAALQRSLRRIVAVRDAGGGMKIRAPRTKAGHGDDASALVLALHGAHKVIGRGPDPLPRVGRPSPGLRQLGIVDTQGRRQYEGAFEVTGSQTAVRRVRRPRRGNFGGDNFGSGGF